MPTVNPHLNVRSKINTVYANVKDLQVQERLGELADRAYLAPTEEVLRDLDRIIGELQGTDTQGLFELEDCADQIRSQI